jgi:PIN domain nuclease of toxin-antitoxin system
VRLLLDTHTFLWWCADDPRLTLPVIDAVGSQENEVYLSVVSGWEIAIKSRLGRLPLPEQAGKFVRRMIERHALAVLPVNLAHTLLDADLPAIHNDPFDRLLVAQAKLEGMTLVTDDRVVTQYAVETLW